MHAKVISALLSLSLIAGCAVPTKKEVADKWVGRHISEAISEMGPPQGTIPLPGGITIYTWEQQYGSAHAASRTTCRKGMHVNTEGRIVDASQLSESLLCR